MAARSLTRYKSCSDEESSSVSGPTHHHRQLRPASSSRSASRDLGHESGFQSVASLESSVYETEMDGKEGWSCVIWTGCDGGKEVVHCNGAWAHMYPFQGRIQGFRIMWRFMKDHSLTQ